MGFGSWMHSVGSGLWQSSCGEGQHTECVGGLPRSCAAKETRTEALSLESPFSAKPAGLSLGLLKPYVRDFKHKNSVMC